MRTDRQARTCTARMGVTLNVKPKIEPMLGSTYLMSTLSSRLDDAKAVAAPMARGEGCRGMPVRTPPSWRRGPWTEEVKRRRGRKKLLLAVRVPTPVRCHDGGVVMMTTGK
jgi:hypothetical protein